MRILKALTILSLSFLFATQPSFRGMDQTSILNGPIPMAYRHFISEAYNIPLSQLNSQRGSYLIITPDNMEQYLDELVSFKKSQGFDVVVKTLSETGSTAEEIKNTIDSVLTADPMLEYVLLIGDVDGVAAMPSFYYGPDNDVTDQKYTHLLGNDFFPDVFIGRFSMDSIAELVVMIRKTINYHRQPLDSNPDWLDKALIVAGNYSNTVPIPITPKWTSYWIRDLLLDEGYSSVDTVFYPPTQQGAALIQNIINSGVGIVNYRGWGDANGWHYPEFHVSDVAGLNNGWMTPVFTSFVCNSNDFANNVDPCLGEALIRAGTPSNPKGGVAIVGPSDLHTSTKYNNVINAYMYDAMLDDGIVELAPAVNAGLLGLVREFPNLDGQDEAQEFYFHVYNIVGDPSVSMFLTEPHEFSISTEDLSAGDGFLELEVSDEDGNTVNDAYVSVMAYDSILFKGNTDIEGQFEASITVGDLSSIEVYLNKNGFVQGHFEISVSNYDSGLVLIGYDLEDGNDNGIVEIGEVIDIYPTFINNGNTAIAAYNAYADQSLAENCQIINEIIETPTLEAGESGIVTSPITVRVNNKDSDHIKINLSDQLMAWSFDLTIPIEPLIVDVDFYDNFLIGEIIVEIFPLTITNYTNTQFDGLHLYLTKLDDGTTLSPSDTTSTFSIEPSSVSESFVDYAFGPGDASHGSSISYILSIIQDTVEIFSEQREVHPYSTDNQPIIPTWYGYWAYDDSDTSYSQSPLFDWEELDPAYGGSGGTEYKLDDDDHVNVQLPFEFQYFGRTYDEMTISSNGWVSFELCDIDYFYNYTIPMAMGPKALLAPFWDDLEVIYNDSIRVYTKHDEDNGRFIIEWSRALNGFDEVTEETFAIHLFDQTTMPTESGDGVIEFHYLDIADVDADKNYATVGIEDHTKNEGIQYVFNNGYAPGAADLANERVIRFTTEAPENYVAPLGTEDENLPTGFQLLPAYPNPFNPVTTIRFQLPIASDVKMTVYDILGREVVVLLHEQKNAGIHTIRWNGTNRFGNSVATGTYFVVMKTLNFNQIQKVLLIK